MNKEDFRIVHKIQKTASIDELILLRNNFSYEIAKRVEIRGGVTKPKNKRSRLGK